MDRTSKTLTMATFVVGRFVVGRGRFGEDVVARQALDGVATRQKTRLEIWLEYMGLIFAELLADPGAGTTGFSDARERRKNFLQVSTRYTQGTGVVVDGHRQTGCGCTGWSTQQDFRMRILKGE